MPSRPCRRWGAALALAVLALAGCAEEDASAIRFGMQSQVNTLDPRFATDAASTRVCRLLYRSLVDFRDDFQPVPGLASWRQLSPRRYRFTLSPARAPFHDGRRLDARDVQATYRSILEPSSASPHRGSLDMVASVEVVDDETVDFLLERDDALFPGRLVIGILPAAALAAGHDFSSHPIGSGPFRFERRVGAGHLVLGRVSDGQRVEFLRVARPDVRVLKLLRGELDLVQGDLPPELIGWLRARDEVRVESRPGTTFAYLGFNLEDPVVGDARVRRAIAHAIDRDAIIRHVWAGAARPAGGILTRDHWAGHPDLAGLPFDPARARELLAQAGYPPGRPARIVYKTSTNSVRVRIASIIQDQLARVGLEVDVRTYDWGTFYADIKAGNFQMYSLAWVGIKMPDIFRYVFHSGAVPPSGANRGRFVDAEVDRMIERAETSGDLGERIRLYRGVQERVLEALPYVPLWYEDQVLVARRQVSGYALAADGNYDALVFARKAERAVTLGMAR